jgi:hypothetical protein
VISAKVDLKPLLIETDLNSKKTWQSCPSTQITHPQFVCWIYLATSNKLAGAQPNLQVAVRMMSSAKYQHNQSTGGTENNQKPL